MTSKVSLNVKIVAGSISLSSGGTTYSVSTITTHPNYNTHTFLNDISLLKTSSSIAFNAAVQPLEISATFVEHNINTVAVGWGKTTVSFVAPILFTFACVSFEVEY